MDEKNEAWLYGSFGDIVTASETEAKQVGAFWQEQHDWEYKIEEVDGSDCIGLQTLSGRYMTGVNPKIKSHWKVSFGKRWVAWEHCNEKTHQHVLNEFTRRGIWNDIGVEMWLDVIENCMVEVKPKGKAKAVKGKGKKKPSHGKEEMDVDDD